MVVVLIPDSGRGYLSKIFNDAWMTDYGFLRPRNEMDVGDVLAAKIERQDEHARRPGARDRGRARARRDLLMREKDVSQLLVTVTAELPLAAKEVSGSLSELGLLEATTRDESVLDLRVKDIADPSMPMVGVGMSVSELTRRLSTTAGRAGPRRWSPGGRAHAQ